MSKVILIAGPTASGKSALALNLAEKFDGEIINADSMQVYARLQIITARPDAADEARIPHHLYGYIEPDQPYSVGTWCTDALTKLDEILARGKSAIIIGGTGLYFKALLGGLSHIPDIDPAIRQQVRDQMQAQGPEALHDQLAQEDPVMAGRLNRADKQRIARALEVVRSTGRSLADWQADPVEAPLDAYGADHDIIKLVLLPDRAWLYERCDRRFGQMIDQGALDEIAPLQGLSPDLTAMKALGVPELLAYVRGEASLEEATEKAQTATRQYAKRQMTWMRNQFSDWNVLKMKETERILEEIGNIIINN